MNNDDGGTLYDEAAGPLVRPYMATGGRTAHSSDLDLLSQLQATGKVRVAHVEPEPGRVLMLCQSPVSIAEVAAQLRIPAMLVCVLVDDLMKVDAVQVVPPHYYNPEAPDSEVLEAVLAGLYRQLETIPPTPKE